MSALHADPLQLEPRLAASMAQEYPRFSDAEFARRHHLLGKMNG